jgi:Fur family iron response transcriptional regulator
MNREIIQLLQRHDVRPSMQRVAIAECVLHTEAHPSADEVWGEVKRRFPVVSRATVYNTLQLFVQKGLLAQHTIVEGRTVFDPKTEPHHHFIDDDTGAIHDIPWNALRVGRIDELEGYDVRAWQVVLRGNKKVRRRG